jgi:hypothetical protein
LIIHALLYREKLAKNKFTTDVIDLNSSFSSAANLSIKSTIAKKNAC